MEFKDLQKLAFDTSDQTGWHDNPFNFEARINSIHSEVSEAFDAYRKHGQDARKIWYSTTRKDNYHNPLITDILTLESKDPELINGLTETLNEVRGINHIQFPGRPPKPEGVPIEFADILIWIMDACEILNIDLETAILTKLAYNQSREYRHGNLPY